MNNIFFLDNNNQANEPSVSPSETEEIETLSQENLTSQVILFNDDTHLFDEVIVQIMKACNHPVERAIQLTMQVHKEGKASVYEGEFQQCLRVSAVLEEIKLQTQIIC